MYDITKYYELGYNTFLEGIKCSSSRLNRELAMKLYGKTPKEITKQVYDEFLKRDIPVKVLSKPITHTLIGEHKSKMLGNVQAPAIPKVKKFNINDILDPFASRMKELQDQAIAERNLILENNAMATDASRKAFNDYHLYKAKLKKLKTFKNLGSPSLEDKFNLKQVLNTKVNQKRTKR